MALSHDRNDATRRFWTARPALDPTVRRSIYGPIRSMDPPGFLERLFGRA